MKNLLLFYRIYFSLPLIMMIILINYNVFAINNAGKENMSNTIYDFTAELITGEIISLDEYRGQIVLIVNTASKCGFTPQYADLQELYEKYKDRGFVVLGFPCNQFNNQEPGSDKDILEFCSLNYGVDFPMFAKIDVNGENTHPLYRFLKDSAPGLLGSKTIKWNFTKFLISAEGTVLKRYGSKVPPGKIEPDIVKLLNKSSQN
jgi:glutathione peroxidase